MQNEEQTDLRPMGCRYDAMELHWVDSAALDQHSGATTASHWQAYFRMLNGQHGDLSMFNAFMHNKNQLFIDDLAAVQARPPSAERRSLTS